MLGYLIFSPNTSPNVTLSVIYDNYSVDLPILTVVDWRDRVRNGVDRGMPPSRLLKISRQRQRQSISWCDLDFLVQTWRPRVHRVGVCSSNPSRAEHLKTLAVVWITVRAGGARADGWAGVSNAATLSPLCLGGTSRR